MEKSFMNFKYQMLTVKLYKKTNTLQNQLKTYAIFSCYKPF